MHAETSALGKPDVDLFIAQIDTRQRHVRLTNQTAKITVPKYVPCYAIAMGQIIICYI